MIILSNWESHKFFCFFFKCEEKAGEDIFISVSSLFVLKMMLHFCETLYISHGEKKWCIALNLHYKLVGESGTHTWEYVTKKIKKKYKGKEKSASIKHVIAIKT